MVVIGITGPSGAGKGMASQLLKNKYGFSIIDADEIYHALVSAHSACLDEISSYFGENVISIDGSLDRAELRNLVFGEENREKLLILNKITHKHVVARIKEELIAIRDNASICIIDAPLLIEAELNLLCDFTISVLADKKIRAERIASRDSIGIDDAMRRISSQKDDGFYINNTCFSVQNNGIPDELADELEKILSERRVLN